MSPESLPADGSAIIVAALSARGLAAAARRAGWRPVAIDLFGDADTRAIAAVHPIGASGSGFAPTDLLAVLRRPELRHLPVVYGAGFEACPDLLAEIAQDHPLVGNPPETVRRIKDPGIFARSLAGLGISHPEIIDGRVPAGRYLLKRIGGSGGAHIRAAVEGPVPAGWYAQARVSGSPLSVLFLAAAGQTVVIGHSRQWPAPGPGAPFRFGGAVGPVPVSPPLAEQLASIVAKVSRAFGLCGLNSADFLVEGGNALLIEVNPRPGATLDLFDQLPSLPLFDLHVRACQGEPPQSPFAPMTRRALTILYADRSFLTPDDPAWPGWTADRPMPGTPIKAGWPVCTVLAEGTDAAQAVRHRRRQLAGLLSTPANGCRRRPERPARTAQPSTIPGTSLEGVAS